MRGLLVLTLAMAAAAPAAAQQSPAPPPTPQAQATRACIVLIDSTGREMVGNKLPTGQYQVFAGGGVFGHCQNDPTTRMDSDSFAWYPDRNQLDLIGRVHFQDTTAALTADRATYWTRQERLYAEGHVHTQNRRTRSDLRGPNLDYRRARPGVRDTAEMYATRRPTIRFYSARDSARSDSAEPFVILADRARMRGNDQMWGGGRVTIDRSDVAARADSAALDLGADSGVLIGGPPVVDGKGRDHYHLTGVRIQIGLNRDHDLRRVLAQGQADAVGPDWHLRADTLDAALDSGKVQRAQAWGRTRQSDAVSGTYTVVADSLDILMPAQVMREMRGFGNGRATNRPDSTVTEDDWMVGDTLRAEFAPADSAAPDSAAPDSTGRKKQELRHLTSRGSARALYHIVDEAHKDLPPGINYSRGDRIAIDMRAGKVATVDVVGQVDGVYLEPAPRVATADSARAPGDSARTPADTSRAPRADTTRTTRADSTRAPADSARTRPATSPRTAPADTSARRSRPPNEQAAPRRPVPPERQR
jgi:hypothetical protein